MAEDQAQTESTGRRSGAWRGRPHSRYRRANGRRDLLVVRLTDGELRAAYVRCGRNGTESRLVRLKDGDAVVNLVGRRRRKVLVACVLPKSRYLIKTLEIPDVGQAEAQQILGLEVQGRLPLEFGQAEISYIQLPSARRGHGRYEVYVARRDDLHRWVASLAQIGLRPALILPSAAVWRRILTAAGDVDLMVAQCESSGDGELAYLGLDQVLSVRSLLDPLHGGRERPLQDGLVECIRSVLTSARGRDRSLVVGWIGGRCPTHWANGRVVFRSLSQGLCQSMGGKAEVLKAEPLVCLAARALLDPRDDRWLRTSNLLPRQMVRQREKRALLKATAAGAIGVLLGLVFICAALKISIARYRTISNELAGRTALIKVEGEAVGRKIRQLEAIRAASATQNDFHDVLTGLYAATPQGVTYSRVQLTDSGDVTLRGQAPSLALPFLLPERLEKQPMFTNAAPRDASQVRRGQGTVAEFRIDCKFVRAENR